MICYGNGWNLIIYNVVQIIREYIIVLPYIHIECVIVIYNGNVIVLDQINYLKTNQVNSKN